MFERDGPNPPNILLLSRGGGGPTPPTPLDLLQHLPLPTPTKILSLGSTPLGTRICQQNLFEMSKRKINFSEVYGVRFVEKFEKLNYRFRLLVPSLNPNRILKFPLRPTDLRQSRRPFSEQKKVPEKVSVTVRVVLFLSFARFPELFLCPISFVCLCSHDGKPFTSFSV